MNLHLLAFLGLTCLFIVLLSWWHARKSARQVMLHRATRQMERRIAEQIVQTRLREDLQEELGARVTEGLTEAQRDQSSPP
ncbi:MAG: hypothetical protein L0H19_03820 [Salinisphaera sp.]|nr:hypothetical protein [Salinisphaera sp.]